MSVGDLSYAFDPAKDTPQTVARKRLMAEAILGNTSHTPKDIGEGINAIGQALMYRQMMKGVTSAETAGNSGASKVFQSLFGDQFPAAPAPSAAPQTSDASGAPSNDYFSAIRSAESGGSDTAKNPTSSATGRYQFTTGTWGDVAAAHPELGLTPDGRLDPAQQEKAIHAFTADNANVLSGAGIQPTGGNLYAAHFLGASGAQNVLTQPDNSPVAAHVSQAVVQANPFLAGMNVGQFKQWAARHGGGNAPVDLGGGNAPQVAGLPGQAPIPQPNPMQQDAAASVQVASNDASIGLPPQATQKSPLDDYTASGIYDPAKQFRGKDTGPKPVDPMVYSDPRNMPDPLIELLKKITGGGDSAKPDQAVPPPAAQTASPVSDLGIPYAPAAMPGGLGAIQQQLASQPPMDAKAAIARAMAGQGQGFPPEMNGNTPPPAKVAAAMAGAPASPVGPFPGLMEQGNIDLAKRPVVNNPDGSYSTVRSMSFEDNNGREILVPTVSPDGRIMSNREAMELYGKTGQNLGKFDNSTDADRYAGALHKSQEQFYGSQQQPAAASPDVVNAGLWPRGGQRVLDAMMQGRPMTGGAPMGMQPGQPAPQTVPAPPLPGPDMQASTASVAPMPQDAGGLGPQVAPPLPPPTTVQDRPIAPEQAPDLSQLPAMAGGTSDVVAPGSQQGPSIQQLMQAAGDPWVMQRYGPVVNALLEQKMKQGDPSYALDIADKRIKLQLEQQQLGGAFRGDSLDAQAWNILQTRDPNSKEYATAYSIVSQPKNQLVQTPQGSQLIAIPPSIPDWVKAPGSSGAPGQPPASQASPGTQSAAPATGGATTGGVIPGTKPAPTEMQARNGAIGRILLNEVPTLGANFKALSDPKGQFLNAIPGGIGNAWQSPEYQQAANAVKASVANVLYSLSGASSNPGEVMNQIGILTPAFGDAPATIDAKLQRFKTYVRAISSEANDPDLTKSVEAAISQMDIPADQAAPKAGSKKPVVIDGYSIEEVQ